MELKSTVTDEYPDQGRKLRPDDVYQRAIMRIWCDFVTSRIVPKYFRFLQHQEGQAPYSLEEARTEFLDSLKEFTKQMDQDGPFFLGKEPMMIDFFLAPWVQRLWVFDHFKGGKDDQVWTRWRKWSSAIENLKSMKETASDKAHHLAIYKR
ncbi:hypothetical protein MMC10_000031 [Thelotrema lepadinum]|nr:hypothetical protein [Thelotrema lepadinum]